MSPNVRAILHRLNGYKRSQRKIAKTKVNTHGSFQKPEVKFYVDIVQEELPSFFIDIEAIRGREFVRFFLRFRLAFGDHRTLLEAIVYIISNHI